MGRQNSKMQFHPLMRYMDTYLRAARYKTDEGYLKPNKKHMVNIFVTDPCVNKAIKFTNTLFQSFTKSGYDVDLVNFADAGFLEPSYDIFEDETVIRRHKDIWSPWKATMVRVGEVSYGLFVFEMMCVKTATYIDGTYYRNSDMTPALLKKAKYHHTWTSERNFPTGRLCLMMHSFEGWSRKWVEVGKNDLIKQIPQITQLLKDCAPELLEAKNRVRIEAERQKQEREEYWRQYKLKQEEELFANAVKKSKKMIAEIINAWSESKKLNEFFTTLELEISTCSGREKHKLLQRLSLAKTLIDSVNPLDYLAQWKSPDEIANVLRSCSHRHLED